LKAAEDALRALKEETQKQLDSATAAIRKLEAENAALKKALDELKQEIEKLKSGTTPASGDKPAASID
jgi:cell division protein FtsB